MPSFGEPRDESKLSPEPSRGPASNAEIEDVFDGYRALNDRTNGSYADFLRNAARCTRCASDPRIKTTKKPIPLLCGTAGLDSVDGAAAFVSAHEELKSYRRPNDGSLRFDPDPSVIRESIGAIETLLDRHGLAGLSIGHCGWGDLTARLRGQQLGDGVKLMILGADWYPLTQCANFLRDRYSALDVTFGRFFARLGLAKKPTEQDVAELFKRHRIYLGNTLLCYRTGWDKTNEGNLSKHSFENCLDHLRRHIDAVAPKILVTFGTKAAWSAATVLAGATDADEAALRRLRARESLKDVMQALYKQRPVRGIACTREGQTIAFAPIFHPSMGHANRYEGEYEAIRMLVAEEQT